MIVRFPIAPLAALALGGSVGPLLLCAPAAAADIPSAEELRPPGLVLLEEKLIPRSTTKRDDAHSIEIVALGTQGFRCRKKGTEQWIGEHHATHDAAVRFRNTQYENQRQGMGVFR